MITPVPPAYTIAKASHVNFNKGPRPGPTDYEINYNLRASVPAYSFTKSPRSMHNKDISFDPHSGPPGPGFYEPKLKYSSLGYTICKSPRKLTEIRYMSPGPGYYDYSITETKHRYSMKKASNRFKYSSESPGPGCYSPNLTANIESSPIVKFPHGSRNIKESFITPAPGQYQLPEISKGPKYTIPKANPKRIIQNYPGPGFYKIPSIIGIASLKDKL